jgi:hypothetical protein
MQAIGEWLKAQSGTRLVLYYIGMSWLSAGYVFRWPVMEAEPSAGEIVVASMLWPIYWFFRLATVGF